MSRKYLNHRNNCVKKYLRHQKIFVSKLLFVMKQNISKVNNVADPDNYSTKLFLHSQPAASSSQLPTATLRCCAVPNFSAALPNSGNTNNKDTEQWPRSGFDGHLGYSKPTVQLLNIVSPRKVKLLHWRQCCSQEWWLVTMLGWAGCGVTANCQFDS